MSTIVTRAGKGSPLSWVEADANLTNLNNDKLEAGALAPYLTSATAASTYETQINAAATYETQTHATSTFAAKSANLADLASASAARTNLGLGTSAILDVGTTANKVVQLDGSAKLPAIDGSQLTNLPSTNTPTVRQTVLSGKVDSNGLSSFGGSTGSTTVTTASDSAIIATAAFGQLNRISATQNSLSFTGLSTNGTMYLYIDIASDGSVTTGSTTLVPVYQWGGTYSTTNNQFTFNIQEMTGKVGNGSVANQVYRTFIGEVTVSGGVVSAITWYTLMGRYRGAWTNTLPGLSTTVSNNHNIGTTPIYARMTLECLSAEGGYAIGDQASFDTFGGSYTRNTSNPMRNRTSVSFTTSSTTAFGGVSNTGAIFTNTAANWRYRFEAERGW